MSKIESFTNYSVHNAKEVSFTCLTVGRIEITQYFCYGVPQGSILGKLFFHIPVLENDW